MIAGVALKVGAFDWPDRSESRWSERRQKGDSESGQKDGKMEDRSDTVRQQDCPNFLIVTIELAMHWLHRWVLNNCVK